MSSPRVSGTPPQAPPAAGEGAAAPAAGPAAAAHGEDELRWQDWAADVLADAAETTHDDNTTQR